MRRDPNEPTVKLILGTGAVLAAPLFAGATLAGAVGSAAPAPAVFAQGGGLSLTPTVGERRVDESRSSSATVANTTGHVVRVTIRPRPWLQAADGTVSPDPNRTLARLVRISPSNLTMPAHSRRTVRLTLRHHAPGGSLYGALDVSGVPRRVRLANGITPHYRLIGSLRLNPRKPRTRVAAGAPRVTGRSGRHAILLPVRNLGNTVEPISGRVVLSGPRGGRANVLKPTRVVPRRLVQMTLGTYRGLLRGRQPGRYRLSITLSQSGRTVLRTTRSVRLI
jgi:hypothetical protein